MAQLASEHGDLSAMMRIVGDEIADKSSNVRAEAFDFAVRREGSANNDTQRVAAALQAFRACAGVKVARSSWSGISSALAAFNHITRTLCMWATIAATVRPFPSGAFAFQTSGGRFSIK